MELLKVNPFLFLIVMVMLNHYLYACVKLTLNDAMLSNSVFSLVDSYSNNAFTIREEALLIRAVQENQYDVVETLLKKGVNPSAKNALGVPAILLALENGSIPIVSLFFKNGVSIETEFNAVTLLGFALQRHDVFMTKFLLRKKACLNIAFYGYDLIGWARLHGWLEEEISELDDFVGDIDSNKYVEVDDHKSPIFPTGNDDECSELEDGVGLLNFIPVCTSTYSPF
jgi:hypothetical protein